MLFRSTTFYRSTPPLATQPSRIGSNEPFSTYHKDYSSGPAASKQNTSSTAEDLLWLCVTLPLFCLLFVCAFTAWRYPCATPSGNFIRKLVTTFVVTTSNSAGPPPAVTVRIIEPVRGTIALKLLNLILRFCSALKFQTIW